MENSAFDTVNERKVRRWIVVISVAVPLLVAAIFYLPAFHINADLSFLPVFHACLNSAVTILLCCGYYFIRRRNIRMHKYMMLSAFSLSALFLLSYVLYHSTHEDVKFGGQGWIRPVYFTILITHILLAAVIMPFILITLSRALTDRFDKHRRIARITLPLWLYVSTTGVIVYFLIAPYLP